MLNLQTCSGTDVYEWGRNVFLQHNVSQSSFEEAAQSVAKAVFETFQQPNGSPQFSLVRIFRYVDYASLPPDLVQSTDPSHSPWMALAGTYGLEAGWQDRLRSQGHKLLNIGHDPNLMAQAVYEQINPDQKTRPSRQTTAQQMLKQCKDGLTSYFYVPQASNSPYLPQQGFVKQYGIRSTVGIGGPFLSHAFYFLLAFSQSEITRPLATVFAELTAPISTLLAMHDHEPLWNSTHG